MKLYYQHVHDIGATVVLFCESDLDCAVLEPLEVLINLLFRLVFLEIIPGEFLHRPFRIMLSLSCGSSPLYTNICAKVTFIYPISS